MSDDRFVGYRVTGLFYNSTRKIKPRTYSNLQDALSINLWNDSIWGITENGTKKLLKRIIN